MYKNLLFIIILTYFVKSSITKKRGKDIKVPTFSFCF